MSHGPKNDIASTLIHAIETEQLPTIDGILNRLVETRPDSGAYVREIPANLLGPLVELACNPPMNLLDRYIDDWDDLVCEALDRFGERGINAIIAELIGEDPDRAIFALSTLWGMTKDDVIRIRSDDPDQLQRDLSSTEVKLALEGKIVFANRLEYVFCGKWREVRQAIVTFSQKFPDEDSDTANLLLALLQE